MLVIGAILGVMIGLISSATGDTRLANVLPMFRYKIGWGLIELLFSAVWMFVYWAWLRFRPPVNSIARFFHAALPILSATNLLYHFPTLLTVMSKSARGDLELTGPVNATVFRQLAFRPEVMAHSVHFWLASVAVSGVFCFWLARDLNKRDEVWMTGARFALAATVLQFASGIWLLFATPAQSQSRIIGGEALPSLLFLASLFCAFYLLQNLATLALGEVHAKLPKRCAILLGATILLMTGTLHILRH